MTTSSAMEHTKPIDIRVNVRKPAFPDMDFGIHRAPVPGYIPHVGEAHQCSHVGEDRRRLEENIDYASALITASYHACQEVVGRLRSVRSDICEALAAPSSPEEVIQHVRRLLLQRRIDPKDPFSLPKTETEKEFVKMISAHPYHIQRITNELAQHIAEMDALLDAIAHIIRTEDSAVNKIAKMTDLLI